MKHLLLILCNLITFFQLLFLYFPCCTLIFLALPNLGSGNFSFVFTFLLPCKLHCETWWGKKGEEGLRVFDIIQCLILRMNWMFLLGKRRSRNQKNRDQKPVRISPLWLNENALDWVCFVLFCFEIGQYYGQALNCVSKPWIVLNCTEFL